jgi:hypothetical protein
VEATRADLESAHAVALDKVNQRWERKLERVRADKEQETRTAISALVAQVCGGVVAGWGRGGGIGASGSLGAPSALCVSLSPRASKHSSPLCAHWFSEQGAGAARDHGEPAGGGGYREHAAESAGGGPPSPGGCRPSFVPDSINQSGVEAHVRNACRRVPRPLCVTPGVCLWVHLALWQGEVASLRTAVTVGRVKLVRLFVRLIAHQRAAHSQITSLQADKDAQTVVIGQLQAQVGAWRLGVFWGVGGGGGDCAAGRQLRNVATSLLCLWALGR